MNLHSPLLSPVRSAWARSALLAIIAAFSVHQLDAQVSYTAVDLTPTASGSAQTASGGQTAGFTGSVPNAFSGRATLWTGLAPSICIPPFSMELAHAPR